MTAASARCSIVVLTLACVCMPGDADKIRQMLDDDVGVNRLGVSAHRKDGVIHYAYPVVALVGDKS
jgi:hypothetical protein